MRPDIEFDLLKELVQVGLLATWHRMFAQADLILNGVKVYKKDWTPLTHAYGLLYYSKGDPAAALEILRALPSDPMAMSLTGFLLQQTGQQGWGELCREVCAQDGSSAAKELAAHLLGGATACPPNALPDAALVTVHG